MIRWQGMVAGVASFASVREPDPGPEMLIFLVLLGSFTLRR